VDDAMDDLVDGENDLQVGKSREADEARQSPQFAHTMQINQGQRRMPHVLCGCIDFIIDLLRSEAIVEKKRSLERFDSMQIICILK
jgi:hypothetical protein